MPEIKNDRVISVTVAFEQSKRSYFLGRDSSVREFSTTTRAHLCLRDIFPSLRGSDISCGTESAKHLLAPKMVLTQYTDAFPLAVASNSSFRALVNYPYKR